MSARNGCIWRTIPARPGEQPRYVYLVNGKAHAHVDPNDVDPDEGPGCSWRLVLRAASGVAPTVERAKDLAERAVWEAWEQT